MRIVIVFAALCLVSGIPALGQTPVGSEIGIFTAYNYNIHDADFGGIPIPANCCRDYKDGDGNGYTLGISYSVRMEDDWAAACRLVFADYSAHLEYWEVQQTLLPDGIIELTHHNSIRATIQAVSIEPLFEWRGLGIPVPYLGCSVAIPVRQEFIQQELLLSPEGYEYVHGGRFRNNTSGDIPNAPWGYFSIVAGLSLRLPAWYGLRAIPDVSYLYTMNDVMNGSHWQPHALRAGVSVFMTL